MSSQPECPDGRCTLDECFERLYEKIRALASRLGWPATNPTLTATALAHEAYLKLRKNPPDLANKSYEEVIAVFANAMRQILVDATRRKKAAKRQPDLPDRANDLPIEEALTAALAFEELGRAAPRQARIAEARFLLGMTSRETAVALGLSLRTVEREWQEAREYLAGKLEVSRSNLHG
jgi:RNA polymerase sigma factor (TIGR02999 family)